jgi:outer membrane lipoprotein-sorting protein
LPHQTALAKQEGLKMSNTMGIASAFVLSSLFLSPFAIAEESQTFVAQNSARVAAFEQYQSEMTAKAQETAQTPQASTIQAQPTVEKDS